MGYQMTFKRYELKFMLTHAQKQALLQVMEPYMALDFEMPTPAVVQSRIQPPMSRAVNTPARNDERKPTRRFGNSFRRTANASAEKRRVMKNPNIRDVRRLTSASPAQRV